MSEQDRDHANDAFPFLFLSFVRYFAASAPLLLLALLYSLSWRFALRIGHWPIYMHDDPNPYFVDDPLYDLHYISIIPAILWVICSIMIVPILETFLYRPPALRTLLVFGIYILGWLLLFIDLGSEGSRMAWWLD